MSFKQSVIYRKLRQNVINAQQFLYDKILPHQIGLKRYNLMQQRAYAAYSVDFDSSKSLCVGNFEEHERYPYEQYLLELYDGPYNLTLDFACGMGRMMNRMLNHFARVDGIDLSRNNLVFARQYLTQAGWTDKQYKLYQSDGLGCRIDTTDRYDFIYSTIALQHIAVHQIRREIFKDCLKLLTPQGQACFQVGFGWDNGTHWFDDAFAARATNAGHDVTIPDESHLEPIKNELLELGYSQVQFRRKPSAHSNVRNYHPEWLFIHLWR